MAQCQSNVFFPDDPSEPPQFSDCPRPAETARRTWRRGEPSKGEPRIVISVVRLCARCAKEWDARPDPDYAAQDSPSPPKIRATGA